MSEMVERVAIAIHKSRQERGFSGQALWEFEPDQIKDLFRHSARAAILAVGEPTIEMLEAMEPWTRVSGHQKMVWKAGVDAALNTEKPKPEISPMEGGFQVRTLSQPRTGR